MSEAAEQYYCVVCEQGPVTRTTRFCPNPRCRQPLAKNRRPWPPPLPATGPIGESTDAPPEEADRTRTGAAGATSRDSGLALRFPWGRVDVVSHLEIGRDADFSPLAADLEPYDNISREHAEFCTEGGRLFITDIGSMNGTFVNGEQLAIDDRRELRGGDLVRFAARLEVVVEPATGS